MELSLGAILSIIFVGQTIHTATWNSWDTVLVTLMYDFWQLSESVAKSGDRKLISLYFGNQLLDQ